MLKAALEADYDRFWWSPEQCLALQRSTRRVVLGALVSVRRYRRALLL